VFSCVLKEIDMLNNRFSNIRLSLLITLLSLVATPVLYADQHSDQMGYQVRNLVSNIQGKADHTDTDLVNAWGIAFNPDGVVWVNDGGTGKATLYNGDGVKQGLVVTIPGPADGSKPTGIVFFGGSKDFKINDNPSRFIFATETGRIAGWAPVPQSPPPTTATEVVNNSVEDAIYKGLALSADGNRYLLYATDFHNAKVDVFDGTFKPVTLDAKAFKDPQIPSGFAPFGIQAINGVIFVTYAKQDANQEDDVAGAGLGYVNAYDASGHLLQRVAGGGKLNAPWGVALAPANFGQLSNRLLVGNFGDGSVIAYSLDQHRHNPGTRLRQTDGSPVHIDGLWGISFGNGLQKQATNALFFAAGPNGEADGLYGKIESVSGHSSR
jgi:uncharacterized protein (TIGR03118 family)